MLSPWTKLALSGASFSARAEADPIFTREVLRSLADAYLSGHDAGDPKASPLCAGLPPIRIDVGDDEVLRDDSARFAHQARSAGTDITLAIWMGMPHVFHSSLGRLRAAEQSLDAMGAFVRERLG